MKKSNLILAIVTIFFFSFTNSIFSQNLKWNKTQKSTSEDQTWSLEIDSNNNTIIFGSFSSTMKLGSISKNSKGGRDHYIAKYDCSGNVSWVQTIGSTGDEFAYILSMCLGKDGSIYVTSAFSGTCTFGSANNSTKSISANGGFDIYIAKYDNNGNLGWVKSYGSSGDDVGFDIAVDDSNNIYAIGKFSGTTSFGSKSFSSSGGTDVYVMKMNNSGNIIWVKQGSGSADDDGVSVSIDSKHNVYVCGAAGNSNGKITFNGISSFSSNYNTGYIAKLDINGDCQWLESIYSSGGDAMHQIAIDNNDNIYLAGTHGGKVTATSEDGNNYSGGAISGSRNLCVARYDTSGNLIWFQSAGSNAGATEPNGICMNKDNTKIYVTGYTSGTITFGNYTNSFGGLYDFFATALDTTGNFIWADFGASTGYDVGCDIAVDKNDNLHMVGFYENSFGIDGITLTSSGSQDGVLLKYCNSWGAIDSTVTTTGSTTLCGADSVLFSVGYDPNYTYSWKMNGSTINGANSYYYYASKTGSYSVVISEGGCCSQSQSQSIQVQNLTFSNILGQDTTICGASYMLSANSPQGSKFLWSTGDTSRTITLTNSGVYTIISAYNGCVAYDTIQISLKNLVVNLGNDTLICVDSFVLDAQNSGMKYKWSDGSVNQRLTIKKTGNYSVTVSDAQCSVVDNILVTVDVVTLNLGKDVKTCQNSPYTIDAGTAFKFDWNTGGNTRKITVTTSGDYWCKITDVLGCTAIDTISINYYPAASANFRDSMVASHTIKFIPDSLQYTSYFWTFDGITNSSAVSPTQYFSQSGTATAFLKVITKDGCIDSVTKTVYTTSVASKLQSEYNINLFPNPNNGLFTIDINLQKKSDVLIQSFDLTGRKVYESKLNGVLTGEQLVPVSMQNLTPSIYLIKITIDGFNVIHRFVNIN